LSAVNQVVWRDYLFSARLAQVKNAEQCVQRTSAGVAHTFRDSAPKADSPFGFFPPLPALAANACRSALGQW